MLRLRDVVRFFVYKLRFAAAVHEARPHGEGVRDLDGVLLVVDGVRKLFGSLSSASSGLRAVIATHRQSLLGVSSAGDGAGWRVFAFEVRGHECAGLVGRAVGLREVSVKLSSRLPPSVLETMSQSLFLLAAGGGVSDCHKGERTVRRTGSTASPSSPAPSRSWRTFFRTASPTWTSPRAIGGSAPP